VLSYKRSRLDLLGPCHPERVSRTNPYENVLSRTNVSRLTLDWRYTRGSLIYSSPAIVNGVLYIGSEDFNMYAFQSCYFTFSLDCIPVMLQLSD
jgi:putative pyrroloquinoline-quinone-binding quinoprotein